MTVGCRRSTTCAGALIVTSLVMFADQSRPHLIRLEVAFHYLLRADGSDNQFANSSPDAPDERESSPEHGRVTDVRQSRRCYLTRHLASGPCYHDPASPFYEETESLMRLSEEV